MNDKHHWENVYRSKSADAVSWFQPHAETSLRLITWLAPDRAANIIDVGGGASTLVDDLLDNGYRNLSVLDISAAALDAAKQRLGGRSKQVRWLEADVTTLELEKHSIDVWHDRAVFHFLTDEADRRQYVDAVLRAVKPGGHVIMATFADDGPEKCSGLLVQRYNEQSLLREFGAPFSLLGHEHEIHETPFGTQQSFMYCYCRVKDG